MPCSTFSDCATKDEKATTVREDLENVVVIEAITRLSSFIGRVLCAMGRHDYYYLPNTLKNNKSEWFAQLFCQRCGEHSAYYKERL